MFGITKKGTYMTNVQFEIKLLHDQPVDLVEMANSLIGLNNITHSHIGREHGIKDSKILLSGVKEGSDIYKLALDFGAMALPLFDGIKSVNEVLAYVNSYKNIEKQTVESIRDNRHYNTVDAENIKSFIAPVLSNDDNSSIQVHVDGDVNAPIIVITNADAKNMHNNADFIKRITSEKELEELVEKTNYEKVLIEMHKCTNTSKQVKDSAYCDDIVKGKAISTVIENSDHKEEILQDPFNNLFLVDIEIVKKDQQVKLYRVTKLHNIVAKD